MIPDIHTYARKGLQAELARLDAERERVRALLASLGANFDLGRPGNATPAKRPRQMSEAGRQAIRDAVKRRWAKARAADAAISDASVAADRVKTTAARPAPARSQGRARVNANRGHRKK